MSAAQEMIKGLAENSSEAIAKFKDYERIIVNFYQLIYWMRPLQALESIKHRLQTQIERKEKLRNELQNMLHELKSALSEIIIE